MMHIQEALSLELILVHYKIRILVDDSCNYLVIRWIGMLSTWQLVATN